MKQNQKARNGRRRTVVPWHRTLLRQIQAFTKGQTLGSIVVKALLWTGMAGFLTFGVLALLVYTGSLGHLPTYGELKDIRNATASEVYSGDGLLLGKYFIENRVNASNAEISPHIVHALIATEDARFFQHSGIDFRAWLRVLVKTVLLSDASSGGGSTLSQQLAKNLYPRKNFMILSTIINKIRETFVAHRLEEIYTKEELLNLYLNTVPFSENTYGVKVAAARFFNTTPKKIKVEQAATLIGMLKGTTLYNPVRNPERALQRRNTVLNLMVKNGYLEAAACERLKSRPLGLKYQKEGSSQGIATYFREHLRQELAQLIEDFKKEDGTPYNLYTDGLKIYTTIHYSMQRYAEQAVKSHLSRLQRDFLKSWGNQGPWNDKKLLREAMKRSARYQNLKAEGLSEREIESVFKTPIKTRVFDWNNPDDLKTISPWDSLRMHLALLRAGFMALEPETGVVRAWVGGVDFQSFQYDHTKSKRQVGSTFKPIVYATALMEGMLPCEYTPNQLTTYVEYDNWAPANSDDAYGGVYSMEGALSGSVNTVAVEVLMRTGLDEVRRLAQDMGISSKIPEAPSIALGTTQASLREMVTVYATLANQGRRPLFYYLERIETADGKVLLRNPRPNPEAFRQVIPVEHAAMVTRMLQTAVNEGTGKRLRSQFGLTEDIAGKTGTTQNNTDGWFIGYTPHLVAGVWVGAEWPQVHFRSTAQGQGANSALPIWGRFMQSLRQDSRLRKWSRGEFPVLPDTLSAMMDCPYFLSEMPIEEPIIEGYESEGGYQ